jgi:ribonuclease HI
MAKHRVRTHDWSNGILETRDIFFNSFVAALEFTRRVRAHHVKIYDDSNYLVHDSKPIFDTYA